jgi:hypothetical protein
MEEERKEVLSLEKTAEVLLNECRMVLPGIQALLGFQLTVVFSAGFSEKLGPMEQRLHLVALALIALSVAVVMTPAAYSRQTEPGEVTERFIRISTRLLVIGMWPLAVGIALDCYLIAGVLVNRAIAAALSVSLFVVFLALWYILPRSRALQLILGR